MTACRPLPSTSQATHSHSVTNSTSAGPPLMVKINDCCGGELYIVEILLSDIEANLRVPVVGYGTPVFKRLIESTIIAIGYFHPPLHGYGLAPRRAFLPAESCSANEILNGANT